MANKDYEITIVEQSANLTKKQMLNLKSRLGETKIDEIMRDTEESVLITPHGYAILHVHTEHAKAGQSPDFDVLVVIADEGNFSTGSETFRESFLEIYHAMEEDDEPWALGIDKVASKNRAGKYFYTCHVE